MELGVYRLAEINAGGGLRQKAQGTAGQYLNGEGAWTTFPTALAPTAHYHSADDITSGALALARIPTGTGSNQVALGNHTHLYAGSASAGGPATTALACTGNSATATKLETTRALTIGNTAKNFDGSAAVSWTLAEIGANQWQYGQYGTGSIKTNSAIATGLRSGDEAKPYVYWSALAGQDLKAGGLAGTDQKWMLISPSTVATYAYGGVEYTYNNARANYVFLLLIDNADFIGSATSPFNRCRIIANAGTNYLSSYLTILTVGSPITGNVYPVIVSTNSSTAPSGITYTESVSLYVPLKSSSTNYTGNYSVASGYYSVASGLYSVASGGYSVASGAYSVASGVNSVASGHYSVASGASSVASGNYSVASGNNSVASGTASVASGRYSIASGGYSVASGVYSVASGNYSFASGAYSVASDYASVASGAYSVASGEASVASGLQSVASGDYSVALGRTSVASGESQTVIGKYNVANTSSAFIIGNGTSTSARSNCMTVDFSGNMTLAGSVAIGATGDLTIPKHAGANRLAYFDAAGKVQSDASLLTTSFSKTNHNHDTAYLQLSGGTLTGSLALGSGGTIIKQGWDGNRIAYFVAGELTTNSAYTLSSFALADHNHDGVYSPTSHTHSGYALAAHNHDSAYSAIGHDHSGTYAAASHTHSGYATSTHYHSIPELYCGVPEIVPGRLLISGSGASSNPTWLDAGTNGKILGWTSGAPAWVDAPSGGSSVSPGNPTASVALTAKNGTAATFMRSDAAPKLDVSISPTWTGAHTFNGLTQLANVGIGVAPNAAYKLYLEENKTIDVAGSYMGSYIVAKYNTGLSSGSRQGIALLGQLWATGGTLTNAKGLDFKVYVQSGHVTEATAINAVIQTDGGTVGTAYGLKIARLGTAVPTENYGIWQDDAAATNVFKGPCQFDGGTNLVTSGRARNIRFMTASGTINHVSGTDTLIIATNTVNAGLQLPTTATAGDRVEFYATDATAYFTCTSALIWPFKSTSDKVTSWGDGMGAPAYSFAIWDGSYWRVGYLNPQY